MPPNSLDINQAVYEWNCPRQLLEIQARQQRANGSEPLTEDIFTERFLLRRPLQQVIDHEYLQSPILRIDELAPHPPLVATSQWQSAALTTRFAFGS